MLTGSDMRTNTLTSGIVSSPARPRIQNADERGARFSYLARNTQELCAKTVSLPPNEAAIARVLPRIIRLCLFPNRVCRKTEKHRPKGILGNFVRMICADPPIADCSVRQLASPATAMPDRGLPGLPHSVAGIRTMNFRRPLAPHCQRFSRWGDCGAALGPVAS